MVAAAGTLATGEAGIVAAVVHAGAPVRAVVVHAEATRAVAAWVARKVTAVVYAGGGSAAA